MKGEERAEGKKLLPFSLHPVTLQCQMSSNIPQRKATVNEIEENPAR